MERAQLSRARHQLQMSQQEVADRLGVSKAAVHRWEKAGDVPQPLHLRNLCTLFGMTARELGFDEEYARSDEQSITTDELSEGHDPLAAFRASFLPMRLLHLVWNWSDEDARYHVLQQSLPLELEDNTMTDELSRRDALRFLAMLPVEVCGLTALAPVFRSSPHDILTQCAAGITACWHLRKGKDLAFANHAASAYLPTLKALVKSQPAAQRKAAADLTAQGLLLKSTLARAITTTTDGIMYAKQAKIYADIAESPILQVTALRSQAASLFDTNQWEQALQVAEQARYLLEEQQKPAPSQQASVPIPRLVHSYVYAGLATYQAYDGRKDDALLSLKKAHTTFFSQPDDEIAPLWTDHHIGNLLINDGETHMHLGLYKDALDSLSQVDDRYAQDTTISQSCRINVLTTRVMVEVIRSDQPRDMEWCIQHWEQAIEGAKLLQSNMRFNSAIEVYTAMRAAWPAEKRIKDLRAHIKPWRP